MSSLGPHQPIPAPELPTPEFDARLSGPREFDGSKLVSKEEWLEAQKHDPYLQKIEMYRDQDRAYICELYKQLYALMKPVYETRRKIKGARKRIDARVRQHKHFAKLLRKRLAWEKMKALRKEIGLS